MTNRQLPGLSWPRISDEPIQVSCHFCDALQEAPRLLEGNAAYCCRCGEMLYQNRPRSLARATAFSAGALIFMVLAHIVPSITVDSGSMLTELTLVEAADAIYREGNPLIGAAVIIFTMISPLILMGGLFYVAAPLRFGIALPGHRRAHGDAPVPAFRAVEHAGSFPGRYPGQPAEARCGG